MVTKLSGIALALAVLAATVGASTVAAQTFNVERQFDSPVGAAGFGSAASVDGSTLVVGAPSEAVDNVVDRGAVYVYVRQGSTWTLQQRIIAPLAQGFFGTSVAVSGDTLAVGNVPVLTRGEVRIYQRTGTTWAFQTVLNGLTTSTRPSDTFGRALSLKGDTLVVGAPQHSTNPGGTNFVGAAYVFQRSGTTWVGGTMPAPAGGVSGSFGTSVGVDGDVACVGAPFRSNGSVGSGVVHVYRRQASGWVEEALLAGSRLGQLYGGGCAVSGDTVAVAYAGPTIRGGQIHRFVGGAWLSEQVLEPLVYTGWVRVRGNVVVFGGSLAGVVDSGVLVYDRGAAGFAERQRIDTSATVGDFDGTSLAVAATDPLSGNGRAFVYRTSASPPPTLPPGAPTGVNFNVSGNVVRVEWSAPTSGGAPTSYNVVARTSPGDVPVEFPMGLATSVTTEVGNGAYWVSVLAANDVGRGPESNMLLINVPQGGAAPPGAPTSLTVAVAGAVANFNWLAPTGGGPVASYVLEAGLAPNFATPFATLPLTGATSASIPGVPPGTYYARVAATNAGGAGPPSNTVEVTVLSATRPAKPTLDPPVVNGRTVTLSWRSGVGGGPAANYKLISGQTVLVPLLLGTSETFSNVPAGTYSVQLVAVNGAGDSPPSDPVTLTVQGGP